MRYYLPGGLDWISASDLQAPTSHYWFWFSFCSVSNTCVGSKLQPLADWYNSPVSWFQDKEVLEPLTASNTGAESDGQKPLLGFNAAVKSQFHYLSQVPAA